MARFLRQIGMREESERAEPVIEGDDDGTFGREVLAVIPGETAGAAGEASAIDPHHHRTLVVGAGRTRPNVGVKAIFAARRFARGRSGGRRLAGGRSATSAARIGTRRARRAERIGLSYAIPPRRRLRRSPPVLTERRGGERNAPEDAHRRLGAAGGARE